MARHTEVCDKREAVLASLSESYNYNKEVVLAYGIPEVLTLSKTLATWYEEAIAVLESVTFEEMMDSDEPVDSFYTEEMLEKVSRKFTAFDLPSTLNFPNKTIDNIH